MYLGIDIGTSGVRIAATDSANTLIALSTAPIAAPVQAGLRILQDPAIWWTAVEAAMRTLDVKGHRVHAIAVDGTSGTILATVPVNA